MGTKDRLLRHQLQQQVIYGIEQVSKERAMQSTMGHWPEVSQGVRASEVRSESRWHCQSTAGIRPEPSRGGSTNAWTTQAGRLWMWPQMMEELNHPSHPPPHSVNLLSENQGQALLEALH